MFLALAAVPLVVVREKLLFFKGLETGGESDFGGVRFC